MAEFKISSAERDKLIKEMQKRFPKLTAEEIGAKIPKAYNQPDYRISEVPTPEVRGPAQALSREIKPGEASARQLFALEAKTPSGEYVPVSKLTNEEKQLNRKKAAAFRAAEQLKALQDENAQMDAFRAEAQRGGGDLSSSHLAGISLRKSQINSEAAKLQKVIADAEKPVDKKVEEPSLPYTQKEREFIVQGLKEYAAEKFPKLKPEDIERLVPHVSAKEVIKESPITAPLTALGFPGRVTTSALYTDDPWLKIAKERANIGGILGQDLPTSEAFLSDPKYKPKGQFAKTFKDLYETAGGRPDYEVRDAMIKAGISPEVAEASVKEDRGIINQLAQFGVSTASDLLSDPAAWLGLVGTLRKLGLTTAQILSAGKSPGKLQRVLQAATLETKALPKGSLKEKIPTAAANVLKYGVKTAIAPMTPVGDVGEAALKNVFYKPFFSRLDKNIKSVYGKDAPLPSEIMWTRGGFSRRAGSISKVSEDVDNAVSTIIDDAIKSGTKIDREEIRRRVSEDILERSKLYEGRLQGGEPQAFARLEQILGEAGTQKPYTMEQLQAIRKDLKPEAYTPAEQMSVADKEARGAAMAARGVRSRGSEIAQEQMVAGGIPGAEDLSKLNLENRTLIGIIKQYESDAANLARNTAPESLGRMAARGVGDIISGGKYLPLSGRQTVTSQPALDAFSDLFTRSSMAISQLRRQNPLLFDTLVRNLSTTGKKGFEATKKVSYPENKDYPARGSGKSKDPRVSEILDNAGAPDSERKYVETALEDGVPVEEIYRYLQKYQTADEEPAE